MLIKSLRFNTRSNTRGFTLLELVITLSIASILCSITIPSFTQAIESNRANSIQSMMRKAIYTTRMLAITEKNITILCPIGDGSCGNDWNAGYMIFTDKNNDRVVNEQDRLIEYSQFKKSRFSISWRASAGRNFLRYTPTGIAREFGRFTLCHNNGDREFSRSIVINRQGRLRIFRDNDRDGIVEDLNGDTPRCA